jgi:hypothetical protein
MYKNQSKPLTVNDIFEAYNTHKDEFLILDIFPDTTYADKKDKLRSNSANTVQYGDVLIHKMDGSKVPLVLKFIQLTTLGKIKEPKDRDYESLKLSFRKNDKGNPDSQFGEAMDLICRTFEAKINTYTQDGKIAVKPKAKSGSLRVHSTTPTFPMQFEVENRETGCTEELDNPILWFELKTQFYKSDELDKLEQFENLMYKKDGKPVVKKQFGLRICDLSKKKDEEVIRVDSRTGKEIRKITSHIPIATDDDGNTLTNCNIQDFITPGSAISGYIEMQLTISGRAFNLKTTFKGNSNLYVYPNPIVNTNYEQSLDSEEVDEMIPQTNGMSKLSIHKESNDESDGEEYDDEDDLSSKLDAIADE